MLIVNWSSSPHCMPRCLYASSETTLPLGVLCKKPFCINPECSAFVPEEKRGYVRKKTAETAEDTAAEKSAGKKTAAKATAKKTAEKKTATKKTAEKKTAVKKTATKKTAAKKTAKKEEA